MTLLVTGGAGFIGSAVVRAAIARGMHVVNIDALTYAACPDNFKGVQDNPLCTFVKANIRDAAALASTFEAHSPTAIVHRKPFANCRTKSVPKVRLTPIRSHLSQIAPATMNATQLTHLASLKNWDGIPP